MFVKELGELSSGTNNTFYSMYHKRQMRVHFELIASLGDQPERRSMNYIMGGIIILMLGMGMLVILKQYNYNYRHANVVSGMFNLLQFSIEVSCVRTLCMLGLHECQSIK